MLKTRGSFNSLHLLPFFIHLILNKYFLQNSKKGTFLPNFHQIENKEYVKQFYSIINGAVMNATVILTKTLLN